MIEDIVVGLLRQISDADGKPLVIAPATADDLHLFESRHGIALTDEIRSWLQYCNGANVNPCRHA